MWTVLLVEDEREAMEYLKSIINWENKGFQIIGEAINGQEGLEYIRKYKPDLVITDIDMPLMDGVELLKEASKEGYASKFIMLTCMNEFEYAQAALEYGASSYILKLSMDKAALENALLKISKKMEQNERFERMDKYLHDLDLAETTTDHPQINKIIKYIKLNFDKEISLRMMAEFVAMDSSYLSDLFKKKTGETLTRTIQHIRVEAAKFLLKETDLSVHQIGERVGFANDNYFNRVFKRWVHYTPNEFRKSKGK